MVENNNFWKKIKERNGIVLALAPMAGFTDSTFRQICKEYGADVLYSEMASVAALYYSKDSKNRSRDNGAEGTKKLLRFNPKLEEKYVVQIFGAEPKHFAYATKMISEEIKPDGIDINFGCPVGKIVKQGAGADLMKNLKKSREVVKAVLSNTDLPVSIKIRAGSGEVDALTFLDNLSDLDIKAVMIHGRTLSQGFVGDIDCELIKKAKNNFPGLVLANGGINTLKDAKRVLEDSEADGLGIARGALSRPWLFSEIKEGKEKDLNLDEILDLIDKHVSLFNDNEKDKKILELRKHLVWYVQGFKGAKKIREKLVKIDNVSDVKNIVKEFKNK